MLLLNILVYHLIKAAPGSTLDQTSEDAAHTLIVNTFIAVEHQDLCVISRSSDIHKQLEYINQVIHQPVCQMLDPKP